MAVRLHDRRDEVRQLLVPGLDPWALIDEELLPVMHDYPGPGT